MDKFKKLKEYGDLHGLSFIKEYSDSCVLTILNPLDGKCEFLYDGKVYKPCGEDDGSHDFLLEYYVKEIRTMCRIKNSKLATYTYFTLNKEEE